jgi:hypothetical protein
LAAFARAALAAKPAAVAGDATLRDEYRSYDT